MFQTGFSTRLTAPLNPGDTTATLQNVPTATSGRLLLSKGVAKERVSYSGVSLSKVTGLVRQLSTTADPATSGGNGYYRGSGTTVELVAMHDQLADTKENNTFTGTQTFENTTVTTNLQIPRYADTIERDTAIPNPTGKEIIFTGDLLQTYNTTTTQRETKDTGTPPPQASETAQGIVELATQAEATSGTDTERAMTPATTKAVIDTIDKSALYETGLIAGESIAEGDHIRKGVSGGSEDTSKRYKASASTVAGLPTDYSRIATSSAALDGTFSAVYKGLYPYTGLTANTVYYASDTDGLISATPGTVPYIVGETNANAELVLLQISENEYYNNTTYGSTTNIFSGPTGVIQGSYVNAPDYVLVSEKYVTSNIRPRINYSLTSTTGNALQLSARIYKNGILMQTVNGTYSWNYNISGSFTPFPLRFGDKVAFYVKVIQAQYSSNNELVTVSAYNRTIDRSF